MPFQFVEADVCTADLNTLFRGTDIVIHFAAITDAANSFEIANQVDQVNYHGTERVAQACLANGSRMLFFSTTSVYGTKEKLVDENCSEDELKPQSPYAASKLKAEKKLIELGHSDGLKSTVFRFGTIFGPSIGMRFHTAINKFCWQACVGQPITVWRTALNQMRPYLDLSDAVRAINFIIKTGSFDNLVYNVLTGNATVGEIVNIIQACVPDVQIEYVDSRVMNSNFLMKFRVKSSRHWVLKVEGSLVQGIQDTIRLI